MEMYTEEIEETCVLQKNDFSCFITWILILKLIKNLNHQSKVRMKKKINRIQRIKKM